MYSWLTEHCLVCGSVNHIFLNLPDAHAWECYFCGHKFWIDDEVKDEYIIQEGCYENEAEFDLQSGKIF
jgi:hypothetical protein